MRGVNDFRVKGENSGQLEVIFRKMLFSVIAKHSGFTESDFRKQFSPNSNTPLVVQENSSNKVVIVKLLPNKPATHTKNSNQ